MFRALIPVSFNQRSAAGAFPSRRRPGLRPSKKRFYDLQCVCAPRGRPPTLPFFRQARLASSLPDLPVEFYKLNGTNQIQNEERRPLTTTLS